MGVVYHANYFQYFEVGRTELIRALGCTYADMERDGIRLPVVETAARFHAPAKYDDVLVLETRIASVSAVRVRFVYVVRRDGDDTVLAEGHTVLASVAEDGRPRRLPKEMRALFVS